jgi:hypothetical protein
MTAALFLLLQRDLPNLEVIFSPYLLIVKGIDFDFEKAPVPDLVGKAISSFSEMKTITLRNMSSFFADCIKSNSIEKILILESKGLVDLNLLVIFVFIDC